MRPLWLFDIEPLGAGSETGLSFPVLRGAIMGYLHPLFKRHANAYAIAVPERATFLRVFASTREDLDTLAGELRRNQWMRDYARLSYPVSVPPDFKGNWTVYRRYRIPTLKTDRKEGPSKGALRERRLNQVSVAKMDYFKVRSSSNQQTFTIVVERSVGEPVVGECYPNGYGLSSSERRFALPDIP
jgi:CRISPR-associated endoribonuclease Cas6/Csy4 subtype I-F